MGFPVFSRLVFQAAAVSLSALDNVPRRTSRPELCPVNWLRRHFGTDVCLGTCCLSVSVGLFM